MSDQHCLLIIDDASKDTQLEDYFSKFNFRIVRYTNLTQVDSSLEPAAFLINWQYLNSDFTIIDSLYHRYAVPLIITSDTENEEMCVRFLEAGADDFLVKPIHPRELHARLGAIARRVQRSLKSVDPEKEVLSFANWRLYPASRQLFDNNHHELQLSAGEYDLLLAFVRQPQCILGREFLLQITKSGDLSLFDRRIDVQISRLRQKIESDARHPALIKTIRNVGYLFTSPVNISKKIHA